MASTDVYDEETLNYVPLYSILAELDNWTLPDWATSAFQRRLHLISPSSFPRYSSASESKLKSLSGQTSFTLPGSASPKSNHKLTEDELKLALHAASKFDLDASEALVLVRSFKVWLRGPKAWTEEDAELDLEDMDSFQIFYFDERLAVIHLLRAISSTNDDPELPDALRDFYQPIAKQLITADLSQQVLDTIQQLTVRDLPDLTSAVKASEFSKQFLREQSAWLDMLFLWWYKHPATGPQCASLLTTIHQTEFGNKQAHMGFWDPEATHQAKVVKHAFVLVSLVALNLESFATTDGSTSTAIPYQSQALPDQIELLHPDTLKAVHAQVISLAQGFADFSAPLVLGWSHILCCLTEGLQASQEPVKSEYAQFVDELTQGDQPLWQRLLSHVLPRLFACLSATLSIALTSTPEPLGALSVLRTPLAILPTMVELSFLPEPHLIAMNDFAVQLFSHPEAQILRHQFWANKLSIDGGEDAAMLTPAQDLLTIGQERAFDFHARRFPLHPLPFLRLLRGLSGSPQSAEAEWATLSLRQLPCITCLVPTSPIMRPYDIDPSDSQRIVVAHPNGLRISKSVVLPVGTSGWLLSEINGPKAVARFELPEDGWNAWLWIQDVLEQYASTYLVNSTSRSQQHQTPKKRAAPHDPFSTDSSNVPAIEFDSDKDADHAAAAALDLLAKDMLRDASSLKSPKAAQDCANMLFAVLEKALFTKAQGVSAAALRALKALLPAYPGMVWSLIRAGKADLFTVGLGSRASRGGTALLAADRSSGTYDSLFALLNLVQALVEETRLTVVDDDYLQVKAEVLSHAFTWLLEEVLTAGFGSWRFQDGKARWQLAKLLLDVFATVAEDALLGDHGHLGGAAEILLSPLLTECTSSNGDCIMPIIGILAAAYDGIVTGIKAAVDAGVCRSALRCSLQLILQLLFLRKHRMPQKPSLLERALISTAIHSSKPGRSTSRAPIATLFACCLNTTALHFSISELAAQVLTTVALFVTDFRHTSLGMQTLTPIFSNPEEQSHQLFNVANDSHAPITLRIAVWQLMTALMDTQPAVTMLFALGRLGPPDAEIKIDKSSAVTPSQHTNNVRRSVEVVKSADELPPEILQAVLSFIESTWERVQDFPAVMQPLRDDEDLWKVIIRLSTSPIPPAIASTEEPDSVWVDEAATGQCYRTLARATATRLVCADLTARLDSNAQNANNAPSFALLLPILKQSDQLSGAYLPTLTNDADIPLHADLQVLLKARFPSFDFASVRRASPLGRSSVNVQRKVGTSYLYDAELATRRMRSCTNVEYDADEILEQLLQINLNWSFIDSQLAVTRAWKDLLGTAYPYSRAFAENESKLIAANALVTSVEAIESISQEDQRGDLIAAIHSERLLSLTAVLEGALFTREPSLDQSSRLVAAASRLLDSGCLSAFDSIKVALTSGFHRHLISALHFVVTIMGQPSLSQSTLSLPSVSAISRTLETSIRLSILNLRYLLTCPFTEGESLDTLIQDVSTVTSLFQAIIKSPYSPPASTWLAYCLEGDLFRLQLSILSSLSLPFTQEPSKVLTVTQSILGLFLAMASFPPAAERLATEGFLHAITTSPIASLAEEGTIKSQSLERPSERDPMHSVWCSITAIIAQLSMFLSHSSSFVAETIGYAQLFHAQLKKPLGWNSTDSLTLSDIDEMQATIALVAFLARRAPESEATRMLQDDIWTLVNTLVYCIQHPNTLLSTLEPIAFRERQWLDKAIREPSKTDAIGFGQRPSTGALIQVFLNMLSVLLESCCIATRAFDVLANDQSVWPFDKAVIYPTAKVGVHEPATIGALIDLATWCIDLLRHHPGPQSAVGLPETKGRAVPILPMFDESLMRICAKHVLEAAFLLSTSQMALVFAKAGQLGKNKEMVRMRRDIATELAPDLLSLISKASNLQSSELKRSKSAGSSNKTQLLTALQRFISLRLSSA